VKSNRRTFVQALGVGAIGAALPTTTRAEQGKAAAKPAADGPVLQVGNDIAIADTAYGKVRGYILRDMHYFLGIPYGADTSGANRFMPPQKPKPWTDTFNALFYGPVSPQNMENRYRSPLGSFRDHWNYSDATEDCLRINVFTPALKDGKKRPVMFWIHGGGYTSGNGIEQDGYNGENCARRGDVVFCSVNHRLGPVGFCNLAGVGGNAFAASGNVGMLDLVAALEWVRDNIANFGGDPGNVTIMGQSGGGSKVCMLTAMPWAKGLFHKAVVLSGATLKAGDNAATEQLGSYVMKEAGLAPTDIAKLQAMPWKQFLDVANAASRKMGQETNVRAGFSPSVDGVFLPQHPFSPAAAPTSANVPMIICSVLNESAPAFSDASAMSITLPGVVEKLKSRFGDKTQEIVDAYAKAFPKRSPVEIWSMVASHRQNVAALADAKAAHPAPVFVTWFHWQPPLFDRRIGAFHCLDICFWFANTDLMLSHTGGGAKPRALSEKMSASLLQFMRTGDPNAKGLTPWSKYTSARGETLVLDDTCTMQNDPDREARKSLPKLT